MKRYILAVSITLKCPIAHAMRSNNETNPEKSILSTFFLTTCLAKTSFEYSLLVPYHLTSQSNL